MMVNPWISKRVLSYAHQGGAFEAPSSTLFAMETALANGANGLELDLHTSSDGQFVCVHDDTLDRTTSHKGLVRDHSLSELKEVDAAFYFVPGANEAAVLDADEASYAFRGRSAEDPRFRIPTLQEVVAAFPNALLNLDLKEDLGSEPSSEEALGNLLQELGAAERTIVASFLEQSLHRFREQFDDIATSASPEEALGVYQGFLTGERPDELPFVALQIPASYGGIEYLDSKFVDFAHECGVAVHAWTINDEAQMERLISFGVDGIISDRPSLLRGVLERTSLTWDGP